MRAAASSLDRTLAKVSPIVVGFIISCLLSQERAVQTDVATAEPRYTRAEIVELDRPAWHLTFAGTVDYLFDGINFWCDGPGLGCPLDRIKGLPEEGWRHRADCRCEGCRGDGSTGAAQGSGEPLSARDARAREADGA
jgi:hypothetical protein